MNANTTDLVIAALMGAALIGIWIDAYGDAVPFRLRHWMARLPGIGLCARLGRNPDLTVLHNAAESDSVTKADTQLASSFMRFLGAPLSGTQINNRLAFARLAGDFDVHDTGPPILMTLILVFGYGEALMVAVVIASYLQANVTANDIKLWAPWIGLVVAVLNILGSRAAGAMYRRTCEWRVRDSAWRRAGRPQLDTLTKITSDQDQEIDAHQSIFLRFRARVHEPSAPWAPAVIMVLLFGVGLAVLAVRFIDLQREGLLINVATSTVIDTLLATLGQSLAMVVLLVIYVGVQVLGFVHGYLHAYNSPGSRGVFKELYGMRSVEAYQQFRNVRLALVGNLLDHVHTHQGLPGHRASPSVRQVYAMANRSDTTDDIIARVRAPMPSPAPQPPVRRES